MLLLFLGVVLLWCGVLTPLEFTLGLPTDSGETLTTVGNFRDVPWHLLTALLIALPLQNRKLYVLLPLLSVGLDIDHVFGAFLPSPFSRDAHNVVFFLLAAAGLYLLAGRFLALAATAGSLVEVAVDGGTVPLFAPFSSTAFTLPYPVVVAFVVVAAILACFAVRSRQELLNPRLSLPVVAAVVALLLLVYWVAPGFGSFTNA